MLINCCCYCISSWLSASIHLCSLHTCIFFPGPPNLIISWQLEWSPLPDNLHMKSNIYVVLNLFKVTWFTYLIIYVASICIYHYSLQQTFHYCILCLNLHHRCFVGILKKEYTCKCYLWVSFTVLQWLVLYFLCFLFVPTMLVLQVCWWGWLLQQNRLH